MKTVFLRFFVVAFAVGALGSLSIAGAATEEEQRAEMAAQKERTRQEIQDWQDYNSGYNEGYKKAQDEERKKMDEQAYNQNSGCCGGGGQQQTQ